MAFKFVVIQVIGPIFMAAFFAFVQILQSLVYPQTLNVSNLTINLVFGTFAGRSLKRLALTSQLDSEIRSIRHHW